MLSVTAEMFLMNYFKISINPLYLLIFGTIVFTIGYSFIFNSNGTNNKKNMVIVSIVSYISWCCFTWVFIDSILTLIGSLIAAWMFLLGLFSGITFWINSEDLFYDK